MKLQHQDGTSSTRRSINLSSPDKAELKGLTVQPPGTGFTARKHRNLVVVFAPVQRRNNSVDAELYDDTTPSGSAKD